MFAVDDLVDAFGHPPGLEHVNVLEVEILEVYDHPEVVEELDQGALAGLVADSLILAEIDVALVVDEVVAHLFQFLLDPEPALGPQCPEDLDLRQALLKGSAELFDAAVRGARDRIEAPDAGILLLQEAAVDVEAGIFVDFVEHHQHRRIAAEALDGLEPGLSLLVFAAIEHQDVDAAFGEEELVGGVHDLLAAEVPEVADDLATAVLDLPVADVDAVGLGFLWIELLAEEAFDQRRLADGAVADQQDLDFVQGALLAFEGTKIGDDRFAALLDDFEGRRFEWVAVEVDGAWLYGIF